MSDQNEKHLNGKESESSVTVSDAAAGDVSDSLEKESPSLVENDLESVEPDSVGSTSETVASPDQDDDSGAGEDAFDEMDLFDQVLSEEGGVSGDVKEAEGSGTDNGASENSPDNSPDEGLESSGIKENSPGEMESKTSEAVSADNGAENSPESAEPEDHGGAPDGETANHDDSLDVDDILAGLSSDLKNDLEADVSEAASEDSTGSSVDNLAADLPDDESESAGADSAAGPAGEGEPADTGIESPDGSSGVETDAEEAQDKYVPDNSDPDSESVTAADANGEKDRSPATGVEDGGSSEEDSMAEIDLFGDDMDELSSDQTGAGGHGASSNAGDGPADSFEDHLESAMETDMGGEVEIELEPMKISPDDQSEDMAEVHEEEALPESQEELSPSSSGEVSPDSGNDEPVAGAEPESASVSEDVSSGFDDDIGISLDDDELWDESEDEIPLLDEELPGNEESSQAGEDKLVEESPGREVPETVAEPETQSDLKEEPVGDADELQTQPTEEALVVIGGKGPWWLPWLLTAVSSGALFGGIFVLWGMLTSAPDTAVFKQTVQPESIAMHSRQSSAAEQAGSVPVATPSGESVTIQDVRPATEKPALEALALAPFIIPVQRQGELVFFKLTVELIVPDIKTKQELKKREAWVRDAIYTELKGIEVGPGLKGEFLLNYRRPLIKRIEKELAPLEIKDVRLMGYVLK